MGWGIKLPKIKLPKISAPKITMDPSKLVTKATEGVTNLNTQIIGSQVKAVSDLAGQAVGGVGQVMSQPGAGALLGAAGTAFGIPGAGLLAGAFTGQSQANPGPNYSSAIPAQQMPIVIPSSPSQGSGIDSNMMMMIGAGVGGLVLIMVFLNLKKR